MINQYQRVYPVKDSFYLEHQKRYQFCARFAKNKNVLDLGCGEGYGTVILKKSGAKKVIGLDQDPKIIQKARHKYFLPHLSFKVAKAEKLPFPNKSFSLITALELIEHLHRPRELLAEVKRVLSPKGIFILSTPNKANYRGLTSPFHQHEFTCKELKKLLSLYFAKITFYGQQLQNQKLASQEKKFFKFYQKITFNQPWLKKLLLYFPAKIKAPIQNLIIGEKPDYKPTDWQISQYNLAKSITLLAVAKK